MVAASSRLIQAGQVPGLGGPYVVLKDFGGGTLSFEVGGYVPNVHDRGGIASELRYAILTAFAAEGIRLTSGKQQLELLGGGLSRGCRLIRSDGCPGSWASASL